MYQLIAKGDDPPPLGDLLCSARISLVQLAQRLANDREVPMNRVTQFPIGKIMILGLVARVGCDTLDRVENIAQKFADSGGIERHPVLVGLLQKVWIPDILAAYQVHLPAQQCFQVFHQTEKTVGQSLGIVVELVEEVDVASGQVKASAGGRAEEFQLPHAVLSAQGADGITMLFNKLDHLTSLYIRTPRGGPLGVLLNGRCSIGPAYQAARTFFSPAREISVASIGLLPSG